MHVCVKVKRKKKGEQEIINVRMWEKIFVCVCLCVRAASDGSVIK